MKLLADNFIMEGQQVAIELIDDPQFPGKMTFPGRVGGTKPLVRGSRRVWMAHMMIERKIEPDIFNLDMDFKAVLISGGTYKDYLVRSVCDNELRVALSDPKKLEAAERMLKEGVSATRAALALGMSTTQFARYTRRINSKAMQAHIASKHIAATSADALLEAAGQVNRIADMEQDFDAIVAAIKKRIEEDRIKATRNKDKFDEAKHGIVSGYIKPAHVVAWVKAIREGKRIAIEFATKGAGERSGFDCQLNTEKGTVKLPSYNVDLYKLDFATLGEVAGKLSATAGWVEQFYLMKKAQRALGKDRVVDPKQGLLDYFRRHGDSENTAVIEDEIDRLRGVADPGHGQVAPRAEAPLADSIAIPAEPAGYEDEDEVASGSDDESEATAVEFDPAIHGGPADPGSDTPPTPKARKGKDAR